MTTLQVRDVPPDVQAMLKTRAARAGQSLSEYVLKQLTRFAQNPTFEELDERIQARGKIRVSVELSDVLAEERSGRL